MNDNRQTVDDWWQENRHEVHISLWPYWADYILQEAGSTRVEYAPCLLLALGKLITDGANQDALLALAGRELWKSRRKNYAGKFDTPMVTWGDTIHCVDYAACGISFGDMHFTASDMGDMPPISPILRRGHGVPDTQEKNQCALLHLTLGIEWCG